jgi:L-ribulose-5-phosphate 3-epimerase
VKISVVTDEVSSDPESALEILRAWGVDAVELRGIGADRFPEVPDYWRVRLPEIIREFGMSVVAISPGLFQIPPPGRPRLPMSFSRRGDTGRVRAELEAEAQLDHHLNQLLPATIDAALKLGARTIVCFTFGRLDHTEGDLASDEIVQIIRHATEKIAAAGLQLVIEVSELTRRSVDVCRRVNHPALGINWDPGNAFIGGEERPYPDGFELARPFIKHVHFKDSAIDPASGKRAWVVHGIIDWPAAIACLKQDGYDGYISVETHVRPKLESTLRCLERLRRLVSDVEPDAAALAHDPLRVARVAIFA